VAPRIGVTVHVQPGDVNRGDGAGAPDSHYRVAARYARAIAAAGGVPVLLPTHPDAAASPSAVADAVEGVLLSGGRGDRRSHFGAGRAPTLRDTDPVRYDYEVHLAHAAWGRGLPLLGICRGFQTLVEAAGGRLHERLEPAGAHGVRHDQDDDPTVPTHGLRLERRSVLGGLFAPDAGVRVNSFHRQGVARAPDGYRAVAWSEDGLVEAVESSDAGTIGVQFHPEWLYETEPRWLELFRVLVRRAGG
jgi:putative glutamine amidotransferase